jgi:secreted trypsin-like serine protease
MTFKKYFFVLVFCCAGNFINAQDELYAGNPCKLHDGSSGICTIAKNCNWAKQLIKEKRLSFNQLVRCEFEGSELVVCCKSEVTLPSRVDVRKSERACEKYKSIPNKLSFNVIHGTPADVGEFPHMAALGYNNPLENKIEYNCGGSLISRKYILTAAHCVNRRSQLPTQILMGRISLEKEEFEDEKPQIIGVKNIIIHPQFTSRRKYHDIALIELATPVEYTNEVRPACLGAQDNKLNRLTVTGWGVTSVQTRKKSTLLLKGDMDFVPLAECDREFSTLANSQIPNGIIESQLCAVDRKEEDRVDACQGDSGGPLQIKIEDTCYVVGVTSFGITCGSSVPGVYTNVTHYLDWIEEKVWPTEEID